MPRNVIVIIVVLAGLLFVAIVGGVVSLVLFIFSLMARSDAHTCGLAYARQSTLAQKLVGTPMDTKGFVMGSTRSENGESNENITFTIAGPLGEARVKSEGHRSDFESHLTVWVGRDGDGSIVYEGKFDCPELHK